MSRTETPALSVVIPTHERAHLLPRAIHSVLRQSFADFEILVVDDASRDQTAEVVAAIDDTRVRCLRNLANSGPATTRNRGAAAARAPVVTLLDDDDEYLPGFLERTWSTFARAPAELGFTWTGVRWVRDDASGETLVRDEIWRPSFPNREAAYLGFLRSRRIGTNCGLAFRASAFAAVGGFDETFRGGAEDTDLLVRLARCYDFEAIPEVLVKLHMHQGGHLRRVTPLQAQGYERILEKNAAALRSHPDLDAELHYKTGWLHCHAGNGRAGRRHLLVALRRRPTLLRAWGGLVLFTLLGSRASAVHRRLSAWRRRDSLDFPAAPGDDARGAP